MQALCTSDWTNLGVGWGACANFDYLKMLSIVVRIGIIVIVIVNRRYCSRVDFITFTFSTFSRVLIMV